MKNPTKFKPEVVSTDDLINGLKHMAHDHPCCAETIALAIERLEATQYAPSQACPECAWAKIAAAWEETHKRMIEGASCRDHS